MKIHKLAFTLILPAWLIAGCASEEPVIFLSAVKPPAPPDAPSLRGGISKEDDKQIQTLVFTSLLDKQVWGTGNYAALFMQADDDVVEAFIRKYPNHVPPIKVSRNLDLRSNVAPVDKETGQPVMILGADIGEPEPNGPVLVTGRWYAGGATQGTQGFKLRKTDGVWAVVNGQ